MEFSTAKSGQSILSASQIESRDNKKMVIYSFWKFIKADNHNITINYEEYFNQVSNQPDLKEAKILPLKNTFHFIGNYKIYFYTVKKNEITYRVESITN